MKKKLLFVLPLISLLFTACEPTEYVTSKSSNGVSSESINEPSIESIASLDSSSNGGEASSSDGEISKDTSSKQGSYIELPFI